MSVQHKASTEIIRQPASIAQRDAERYRKLRDYLLTEKIIVHYKLSRESSEPFVFGCGFTGETFEEAVDTLKPWH